MILYKSHANTLDLVLRGLLVHIGLALMLLLIKLVGDGIAGGLETGVDGSVAVLGHLLVGLLGSGGAGALDGLADVVGGLPEKERVSQVHNMDMNRWTCEMLCLLDGIHCG